MIRARPTTYKGVQMRSRLEASWAAIFDEKDWPWEYEPMCFADETGQYLPDFKVHGIPYADVAYVEIKPPLDDDEMRDVARRMSIIWGSEPRAELRLYTGADLLVGRRFVSSAGQSWYLYRGGDDTQSADWLWVIGMACGAPGPGLTQLSDGSYLLGPVGVV